MKDRMRHAFLMQRSRAKRRGIGWDLSYEDWCFLWKDKWHQRGNCSGQYCMARIGDVGPYSLLNVIIKTVNENSSEAGLRFSKTILSPGKFRVIHTKER